jgi:ribosomal protein S18 acetylase RimI-like enzyme
VNTTNDTNGRVEIRPLHPDQWEVHKHLRLAALADAPYAFTTQLMDVLERTDREWMELTERRAADPNGVTYFAYTEGEPCAMAACILSELGVEMLAEMLAVWVAPERRKVGVGQTLVDYACTWALEHGAGALIVGVYADNQEAVAFYRSVGFRLTGEERFATRTDHRPILVMSMPLARRDDVGERS